MRFRKYFWISQFWGQNLTFWPLEGLGKSFPEDNIYIVWNALLLSNFMQKIKKFWRAVRKQSLKKSNFGPNLTFWPRPEGVKSFFRKSENVTFLQLCCSNFVQNIKKFWRADPEISALRTDEQTEGRMDGRSWIYRTLSAKAVGPKTLTTFVPVETL